MRRSRRAGYGRRRSRRAVGRRRMRRRTRRIGVPRITTGRLRAAPGYITPPRLLIRMKYSGWSSAVPTSTLNQYILRMNSIYDPDYTGVGHSCMGYNQMSALYNNYRVYRFKLLVQFMTANDYSSTNSPLWIACLPTRNVTFTNIDTVQEEPLSKAKFYDATRGKNVLSYMVNLPAFAGMRAREYVGNEDMSALFGYNPNAALHMQILWQLSAGTSTVPLYFKFRCIYYAELFNPKTTPTS